MTSRRGRSRNQREASSEGLRASFACPYKSTGRRRNFTPGKPRACYRLFMAIAQSRLSPQGQISVPVEVRKRLGLEPGSVIEWDERDGDVVVRRGGGAT